MSSLFHTFRDPAPKKCRRRPKIGARRRQQASQGSALRCAIAVGVAACATSALAQPVVPAPSLLTEQSLPVFQIEKRRGHADAPATSVLASEHTDVTVMDAAPNNGRYATPMRYNLGRLPLRTTVDLDLPSRQALRRKKAGNVTREGWAAAPIEEATPGLAIGDQTILIGPFVR